MVTLMFLVWLYMLQEHEHSIQQKLATYIATATYMVASYRYTAGKYGTVGHMVSTADTDR